MHVCSVVSNSFATPSTTAPGLLCPWDFPGKSTRGGGHFLLKGSSPPKDWTGVSCMGRQILYHWATDSLPLLGSPIASQFQLATFQMLNSHMQLSPPYWTAQILILLFIKENKLSYRVKFQLALLIKSSPIFFSTQQSIQSLFSELCTFFNHPKDYYITAPERSKHKE